MDVRHKPSAAVKLATALLIGATALLIVSLVWSVGGALASNSSPAPSSAKVVLRIGLTQQPDHLNPFIGQNNTAYEIWSLNYSYLFGLNANLQPTLDLAAEFPTKENGGISPDGKVWTIHLRPNMKWQDGVPLTAGDVAWSINYTVKNDMTGYTNSTVNLLGAKATGPTTVQLFCSHPKADMEFMYVPIVPKHIWQHLSGTAAQTTYVNKPPIIGSGPFEVVQWVSGSYVHLIRNPYYYGKKPAVTDIYFEIYENANTMVADLRAGVIDAIQGVPQSEFTALSKVKGIETKAGLVHNWNYLNFNNYGGPTTMGNPVVRDWRFRYALNYAVDRQALARIAYGGFAEPATTIMPPNWWTNPDYHWQPPQDALYTFDLAKANQLLTAAGYPLKNGVRLNKQGKPITLRLYSSADSVQEQNEAKLIAGWFGQIGLKIQLTVMDTNSLVARIFNVKGKNPAPDFDMEVWDWIGYQDPGETLSCFTTSQVGGAENEPYWSNAEYSRLCAQQAMTLDPQKRKDIVWRMQQIMYQQTPWMLLTYPDFLQAYNTNKWTGWTPIAHGSGPAFYTSYVLDTYLNLRLKVGATAASNSSSATAVIIIIFVVAVVVVVLLAWFVRHNRRHRAEEA